MNSILNLIKEWKPNLLAKEILFWAAAAVSLTAFLARLHVQRLK